MLFGKKHVSIKAVTEYDILDRAMQENAKYEELKEYAEATLQVAKSMFDEVMSKDEITLEDVALYEAAIHDANLVTIETLKHSYARDVLLEMAKTKLIDVKC